MADPDYTMMELGQWVHLFACRAQRKTPLQGAFEDLHQAREYWKAMGTRLDRIESILAGKLRDRPENGYVAGGPIKVRQREGGVGEQFYAMQWNGTNLDDLKTFVDPQSVMVQWGTVHLELRNGMVVVVEKGEWVLRTENGNFYPCNGEAFKAVYRYCDV